MWTLQEVNLSGEEDHGAGVTGADVTLPERDTGRKQHARIKHETISL